MNQFYHAPNAPAAGFAKVLRFCLVQLVVALLCSSLTLARAGYNQKWLEEKVSIVLKDQPLRLALQQLEAKAHIKFAYSPDFVKPETRVSLSVRHVKVSQALNQLLHPLKLTYLVIGSQVFITRAPGAGAGKDQSAMALQVADRVVTGQVSSAKGDPLPGVTVLLKGTTTGTSTGTDGSFSLTIAGNTGTLVFSFIGFRTREVPVPASGSLQVVLVDDVKALEEVVVVGYGTQKKVSMTSAVSEVKGEDLVKRPVSHVAQAMQGQAPGLTVLDQGGGPGKSKVTIRVRGITTLSGDNNPLVIVDGIEQRLSDINPDDIESISVLKDASSTAIYGSRAANGVVLITTKRAKAGKVSVTYNGFYALQRSANNPEHMEVGDYMRMQNIAYTNVGSAPKYTEQQIQEYVNATDRYKYPLPYTMAEAVLRPAPQVNHSLGVSGGSEHFKARLSLRYQDQGGIIPNAESQLSEVRVNTDFTVSPKIRIGTDVNYRYVNSLAPSDEFRVFERLKHGSIWTVPKYPDGTYGISAQGQNALMYAEIHGTARNANDFIVGNIKGDWEILKGLTFTTQLAARLNLETGKTFFNSYTINDYYDPSIVRRTVPVNTLTETRMIARELTLNNLLNYSTTLAGNSLNVLAGYSEIDNRGNYLSAYRQGFYNNQIQSIGQGTDDNTKNNGGNESQWGLRSFFGRLNYGWRDKYLFEANGRFDGSSRFTGPNRYSFFPSFSTGWRISEEPFWDGLGSAVNEFKLRGSWGKTGNQAVALYSYYPTLDLVNYSFHGLPVQGLLQQQMTNEDLTWETTTQANGGLEAQFLHNRFSVSVDYYRKRTDGILLVLPVPGTLGLQPSPQNAGAVDNRGWEFTAGSRNHFGAFGLDANVNFSVNNNEVVNLAGTGPYITGSITETRLITGEGYPIGSFWGYKTGGLFQTEEEVRNYPTLGAGIKPGDVKYLDLNDDKKIDAADMTYLGTTFPKYTFGSSLHMTYKGFALNLLWQGAAGVQTNFSGALGDYGNLEGFAHKILTGNYWTPENGHARFPRPTKFDVRNTYQSDREMIDASYLRMKNIQLMYHLPASLTRKAFLERMSVYVSATNLFTFSKLNEWNLDPESSAGRVQDYPQTALHTVGVNLQF